MRFPHGMADTRCGRGFWRPQAYAGAVDSMDVGGVREAFLPGETGILVGDGDDQVMAMAVTELAQSGATAMDGGSGTGFGGDRRYPQHDDQLA